MFAASKVTEVNAVRSLTANEIEAVAGGYFTTFEPIGSRPDVGCGTMVLIDRLIKRMTGKMY